MNVLSRARIDLDSAKRLARFAARRSREDRIAQVAGSLTFTTMLALVPLATVAFALLTAFPIFGSFHNSLQGFLADHLMPAQINSQIFKYLNQFESKAKGLTTMGMIVLFVTSVMTMMTVESAFNLIWRVRKARPFAQRVLVYWAVITLGPILIGASLSISSYLFTRSLAIASEQHVSGLFYWTLAGIALPLEALAFTILYVYLPNCYVQWRDAVVGGIAAAIAFECAKRGFGLYVRRIPTYTAVYGAFAFAPMFLLWVYLSWFITLAGAMITSALPEIRTGRYGRPRFPGSDLLDALELLALLAGAREAGQPGRTAEQLALMLRRDLATVTRLIDDMEQDELIGRLENDGAKPHFLLIANPARIPVADLFGRFVIDRRELAYRLNLKSSGIDANTLLNALDNDKLAVSLATLLAARRTPADEMDEMNDMAGASGQSRPPLPHQAA
ncbi:MAG: YihY family inner membrane protein [Paraburkholderia sp.]|uniref:YihY family inner membrane protein n=2 Tax=Paraburkholderia sp. TaxID=1926495 RepID=UPI0012117862|nr:YihY family inner membrane protein [Paraburkholderia sp.]TAM29050.1 MAG: YihY family inner membrane protein [Paraburkholderia sp.]